MLHFWSSMLHFWRKPRRKGNLWLDCIPNQLTLKSFEPQIDHLTTKSIGSQINWQPTHLNLKSTDNQNHLNHTSVNTQIIWISNYLTSKSFEPQINWQPKSFESQIRYQPNHFNFRSDKNQIISQLVWIWHQLAFEPIEFHIPLLLDSLSLETSATALCGKYVNNNIYIFSLHYY